MALTDPVHRQGRWFKEIHTHIGLVWGLSQPSIMVQAQLGQDSHRWVAALASCISKSTGEALPVLNDQSSPMTVADVLAQALGALQRQINVYASPRHQIRAPSEDPQLIRWYLPSRKLKVTQKLWDSWAALLNPSQPTVGQVELEALMQKWVSDVSQVLRPMADPRTNQFRLHEAADQLGIPVFSVLPKIDALGSGCRARWFNSTITDQTSSMGVTLASNKMQTAAVLRRVGLPGATHVLLRDAEHLRQMVDTWGFPLVIKPNDQEQGRGVAADLRTWDEVQQAYDKALQESKQILLEKHAEGLTHRLTVMEGEVIRVTCRIAGGVEGNGQDDIASLVQQKNSTPTFQRRIRQLGYAPLALDQEAMQLLTRDGLTPEHVLPPGQYVRLRRRDNINAGGINQNCPLDQVHPDNIRLALDIAALFHLDFAGIDLIIRDITQSWLATDGLVCEVNAQPQLRASDEPTLYQGILKKVFKEGAQIPADLTLVPEGWKTDEWAASWSRQHPRMHVACRSGLWLAGQAITPPFANSFQAALAAMMRKDVTALHALMDIRDALQHGLPGLSWGNLNCLDLDAPQDAPLMAMAKARMGPYFQQVIE